MPDRRALASLTLSAAGLVSIAVSEGYRSSSYDDGVGVQTVGFGTAYVKHGTRMTVEQALVALNEDAKKKQKEMKACLGDIKLYQNEWDAYTSLSYNIGTGAFCKSSIAADLKKGDYQAACAGILKYNRAGGKVVDGLAKRRKKEYLLCLGQ